jgi:hypothetical protein
VTIGLVETAEPRPLAQLGVPTWHFLNRSDLSFEVIPGRRNGRGCATIDSLSLAFLGKRQLWHLCEMVHFTVARAICDTCVVANDSLAHVTSFTTATLKFRVVDPQEQCTLALYGPYVISAHLRPSLPQWQALPRAL